MARIQVSPQDIGYMRQIGYKIVSAPAGGSSVPSGRAQGGNVISNPQPNTIWMEFDPSLPNNPPPPTPSPAIEEKPKEQPSLATTVPNNMPTQQLNEAKKTAYLLATPSGKSAFGPGGEILYKDIALQTGYLTSGTGGTPNTTPTLSQPQTQPTVQPSVPQTTYFNHPAIKSKDLIIAGGAIKVPGLENASYKIQSGDTLSAIAAKYRTSVDAILAANNLSSASTTQPTSGISTSGGTEQTTPGATPQTQQVGTTPEQQQQMTAQIQAELDSNQGGSVSAVTGQTITAPQAPGTVNWEQKMQEIRSQYQVEPLENQITELDKQINDLRALYETAEVKEGERLAPMAIISKRKAKISEEKAIELNRLINEKNAVINQLNSKYGMIDTVMKLQSQTYEDARQQYEFEYNKALQQQQLLASAENTQMDNSRATLNSITNMMTSAGMSWNDLDINMQYQIYKSELQAGLPAGTTQAFTQNKPGAKVIATKDGYDASGNAITTFIYEGSDGMPGITYTVKTGGIKTTGSSGGSSKIDDSQRVSQVESFLNSRRGTDGYVSADDYVEAQQSWIGIGGTISDFKAAFPVERYVGSWELSNLPSSVYKAPAGGTNKTGKTGLEVFPPNK